MGVAPVTTTSRVDATADDAAQLASAMTGNRRRGRRARWIGAVAAVVLLLAAAGIAGRKYSSRDDATASVAVRGADGSHDIVVTNGSVTLTQLQKKVAADSDGDGLLVTTPDDAVRVGADLV